MTEVRITDFGARGDGSDDRAAIQAALNAGAGGRVLVPAGRWTVGRAGNAYYCLAVPAGTTLVGESRDGSVLVQADGVGPSVRLLEVPGVGATIQALTLDGFDVARDGSEHRAGIFARAAGLAVRDVTAMGFTGDGIYLYGGADGSAIDRVLCESNTRNGLTFGGLIIGGTVTNSEFRANRAQQLDSEPGSPGHVDDIEITGCTFDAAGASNDYALTVCGSAGADSRRWLVHGNAINGSIYVVWAGDIVIADNTGTNPTSKPSVFVYRAAERIAITGNVLSATAAASVIAVTGTGTGQAARGVTIARNRLSGGGAQGIALSGAMSVTVEGNAIEHARRAGSVAIAVRATNPADPFARVDLRDNVGVGWARGLWVGGVEGTTAKLLELEVARNHLGGPMQLDDGSGALQSAQLQDNEPADVTRWPAGAVVATTVTMTRGSDEP